MKKHSKPRSGLRPIACAVALALAGFVIAPAQAFEFGESDGLHGTVNTTLTYGVSWRVQGRDDDLIGKAQFNPLISQPPYALGSANQRAARGRYSVNFDDGDLNYDDGDVFSNALKATIELNLMYGDDSGLFVRGYTFYDFENVDRYELSSVAKEKVGKDSKILDAFLFHNFEVGGKTGSIRLGQQVVSWGESTFIQGGINAINPIDVSKLRVAGAELKEAFLPVNMIWGSFNFTDTVSGEAFYLFEFEQTDPDPAGTYFSTNDFASLGGSYVMLNFGTVPQPVRNPDFFYGYCYGNGGTDNNVPAALKPAVCGQAAVPRAPDRFAKNSGQYGFRLNYLADWLNNTEFGFYAMNYHSRLPLLSGIALTSQSPTTGRYFAEYPEDIRLFGISFNTQLEASGVALQGELSYRPNQPLQIDDVELLFAALSPLNVLLPAPYLRFYSQLGQYGPGDEIQGWERHKVSQLQFTATKVFGPGNWVHSDQISLVGEVGFTNVSDLPTQQELRYQCDGTDAGGGADVNTGSGRNPITQQGFCTAFSWGYRLAARADYNNAFGSAYTLSPRIAFNHDVKGRTPGPGGNFLQGRKSVTIGAEANYLNQLAFDLSYTNFFGGGSYNLISDRDFVAFSVKYSF